MYIRFKKYPAHLRQPKHQVKRLLLPAVELVLKRVPGGTTTEKAPAPGA
jgi:hypothetical protein